MTRKRLYLSVLGVAIAWVMLAACGPSTEEIAEMTAAAATDTPVPTDVPVPTETPEPINPLEIGDPARGQEFFETGAEVLGTPCERCHSLDGVDGEYGPTVQGISERAAGRVAGLNAEEYLRQSILEPGDYIVEGYEDDKEPFYELLLSDEDIDDIVAYLLTQ